MNFKTKTKKLLCGFLCAVMMTGTMTTGVHAVKNVKIPVETILEYATDEYYNIPDEFIEEIQGRDYVTVSSLRKYAELYKFTGEFLQIFVEDAFIYKSGSSYNFVPLNENLEKNNYDWDNLVKKANNEMKYVVDGKSRAIKGIDVSSHQGVIDWEAVADDGVKFAYIRLGYRGYGTGEAWLDDYYEQNMQGAIDAGIKVGVYFYTQAIDEAEARFEAEAVLEWIQGYDLDLPIAFDVEGAPAANARTANLTKKQMTDITLAFCDTIEEAGYQPIIYSYTRFLNDRLDLERLEGYDKWVANYYQRPYYPYDFQILQYTSKGRVNGIKGNVDMNLCFVNY